MTSAEPSPAATSTPGSSSGHATACDTALCAALATEHAVIYGYGIVSAHSPPDVNALVASAMSQHRERRDQVIAMLAARSVTGPVAAAGYQLPMRVNNGTDAARLAVRMEKDTQVAWRAVIEQAQTSPDRGFGVTALTQSAVLAARWNRVLGAWPITTAFPGGNE
ncbi:MAG: ferritin-like domain-containing protein [Mycobacterium sp.]